MTLTADSSKGAARVGDTHVDGEPPLRAHLDGCGGSQRLARGGRVPIEVLVVDGRPITRRGLVASLDQVEGFGRTDEAGSVADAWANPALGEVDVVVLDAALDGAPEFVSDLEQFAETRVLALGSAQQAMRLDAVLDAGAVAGLYIDELTPQRLALAVRAVAVGVPLLHARRPGIGGRAVASVRPVLNNREQQVLALVADGLPSREVALQLHYSERTVKKVLGDVVVKFGARSRSQAIAHAVREGII
jgi:DNA-binding NarL/FixJ family response regulator